MYIKFALNAQNIMDVCFMISKSNFFYPTGYNNNNSINEIYTPHFPYSKLTKAPYNKMITKN